MRFIAVHKAVSYLMVVTALAAVLLSGEVGALASGLLILATLISWFWEAPRAPVERLELVWNIATLLMLARSGLAVFNGESVLLSANAFVLFLTINRLFNRRTSRDYLQLYILSFLQMTAATVLNADLSYGLLFLVYVVATTWTLILFHLKREMEENYLLKYGGSLEGRPVRVQRVMNSRKLVGARFLLVTSALSLLVFIGAGTVFFLFPRVGFGYFFKKHRAGIAMTGFSDQVELGHFGLIKNDPTVVLRVELERPELRSQLPLYWRGIAFDHYDGQRWTKSRAGMDRPLRMDDGVYPVADWGSPADPVVVQRIYLEPMEARVLFGLARLEAVSLDGPATTVAKHRAVRIDPEGDVAYEQTDELAFRYKAYSRRERIDARLLAAPLATYRERARARAGRYLQLPADLDPEVARLAAEIIGDAPTVGVAAQRVESWLQRNLSYSLDLGRDPSRAPLEDFLFVQRRGHCEYFATALIILLRTQGIAARNVNGFLGGRWNEFGGYMAISQGEAHSWVELWLDDNRWMTRDPTPGGGATQAPGLLERLSQLTDALRMRWYKYIIEYDLDFQAGAVQAVRDAWRSLFADSSEPKRSAEGGQSHWALVALVALLTAAALLLGRWRRSGAATARNQASEAAAALLEALVRAYARVGILRRPGGTAREYLASLTQHQAPDLALAQQVIERYEQVRFGGDVFGPEELKGLRGAVKRIGRTRPQSTRPRPG